MNFQACVTSFIVESEVCQQTVGEIAPQALVNSPKIKVIYSELAVLDFNVAIHNRHVRFLAFNLVLGHWARNVVGLIVRPGIGYCRLSGFLTQELGCLEPRIGRLVAVSGILNLVPPEASRVAAVQAKFGRLEAHEKLRIKPDWRGTDI